MIDKHETYYTAHQVGIMLHVSSGTVRRWCLSEVLKSHRLPTHRGDKSSRYRRTRVAKKDLLELIEKYKMPMPKELQEQSPDTEAPGPLS